MIKPLPGFFFLLSPLVLSFPSFSDEFICVTKLQLVKVKYVTQRWPVIAAFFPPSHSSLMLLPGCHFNLQVISCQVFQTAHMWGGSMLFICTTEVFPGFKIDLQLTY